MAINFKAESPPLLYEFISYLEVERGYSHKTVYNYFIDLRMFFRFVKCEKEKCSMEHFDEMDITGIDQAFICQLSRGDISAFLSWLTMEKGISGEARNRKIAVLKSFYKFLLMMDYTDKNIMETIFSSKTKKTLPKYLEEDKMIELLEVINGSFWIRDKAMILLMMSTGLRVSEVASLNLRSIKGDSLTVLGKGNKERQVYLSATTQEGISDYLEIRPDVEEEALFLSQRKGRIQIRSIQYVTRKYLTMIGKGDYSCHKLRHTAATQLMNSQVNLREIQEILGHESISTTSIYTHVSNEDLKRASQKIKV